MSRRGVLLVGGGGFIGTALARRLADAGREAHVLAPNAENGQRERIAFHRGTQSDAALVRELLESCGTVVHLASATTPGASARSPALEVSANLAPMAVFMEALSGASTQRLIFLSSGGAIYGNPGRLPADESLPMQPLSDHAAGKAAAELFLGVLARQSPHLSLAILRPSNVYGPGQPAKPGFGIVRTLLDKARTGEPVEIWGSGDQVRDFLYIDDLVEACIRLIERTDIAGTFNAGSGEGVSLRALVSMIRKVTGRNIPILMRPERGVDVEAIWLDSGRLREATGWTPSVPLHEGLARTWARVCEVE